jgi:hypothetical protein
MDQLTLRKWHRRVGATIALFVILQAGSGFLLVAEGWFFGPGQPAASVPAEPAGPDPLTIIHFGAYPPAAAPVFVIYRLLLATGLIWMALSGSTIGLLIWRAKRRRR